MTQPTTDGPVREVNVDDLMATAANELNQQTMKALRERVKVIQTQIAAHETSIRQLRVEALALVEDYRAGLWPSGDERKGKGQDQRQGGQQQGGGSKDKDGDK